MSTKPSPQQQVALDFVTSGRGNAILVAVAGSGKTTTLVWICQKLQGSVAFAAYNKKIADEITTRLSQSGVDTRRVRSGTFHSFGFAAWRRVAPNVKVDGDKISKLMEAREIPEEYREFTKELVSLAKQRAVGILSRTEDPNAWREIVDHFEMEDKLAGDGLSLEGIDSMVETGIRYAITILQDSIAQDGEVIDFDDMIYAPLIHNVRMWQNDWVLIDEAQDTNPARRALARKMLKPGGRLIAVGDPRQAIYGFTGADSDSLDLIRDEFSCRDLPLTVTYRCPKSIVALARNWVSHIEAHDSAPDGNVRNIDLEDFAKEDLQPTDAILCRNTAPLVEMAFQLIRRRVACHVEGREIGAGLLALANKWKSARTIGTLRKRLREYLDKEVERLMAKGAEAKAAALTDRVDTLNVLMDGLPDDEKVDRLREVINGMFRDTNGGHSQTVTLSTVHKSKGREWDRVYLLGRNRYMPSPFARQVWQMEQEDNLIYVAITRAKRELVEVVVPVAVRKGGGR